MRTNKAVTAATILAAVSIVVLLYLNIRRALPVTPSSASDKHIRDVFDELLNKQVDDVRGIGFAPDGSYVATITGSGDYVSLFSANGNSKTAWTRRVPGARDVSLTPGAKTVIVYTLRNDEARDIFILRGSDGSLLTHVTTDGSIWALTMSDDGQFAAVITSNKSLYVLTLGLAPKYKRWSLPGIGNSVSFSQYGQTVIAGTWDASGISVYSRFGELLWQYPVLPKQQQDLYTRLFEAYPASQQHSLLALSYSNARHSDGTLYYWRNNDTAAPDWEHDIGPNSSFPRAAISANGRYVVTTYVRTLTRSDDSVDEHRMLVLDTNGNELWDKGGLLFSPSLVSIAPDGHRVTVSDGIRNLYNINSDGRISASWPSESSNPPMGLLRYVIPSIDGKRLLVYTGDGTVHILALERAIP